jgi:hypothetical protein
VTARIISSEIPEVNSLLPGRRDRAGLFCSGVAGLSAGRMEDPLGDDRKGPDVEALEAIHQVQNGMARLKYLARQGGEDAAGIIRPGAKILAEDLRALRTALDGQAAERN